MTVSAVFLVLLLCTSFSFAKDGSGHGHKPPKADRHVVNSSLPVVPVVFSADFKQWVGVLTCLTSIKSNAKDKARLRFLMFVTLEEESSARDVVAGCLQQDAHLITVVPFDAKKVDHIREEASTVSGLDFAHNFVRFYFDEMLGDQFDKIIYIDADTIVHGDLVKLFDSVLLDTDGHGADELEPIVAAADRSASADKPLEHFINVKVLKSMFNVDVDPQYTTFNAGLMVIRLDRWRKYEIAKAIERFMRMKQQYPKLWSLGSQPPLALALYKRVQLIDARWNWRASDIHAFEQMRDVFMLHWNGHWKPWFPLVGDFGGDGPGDQKEQRIAWKRLTSHRWLLWAKKNWHNSGCAPALVINTGKATSVQLLDQSAPATAASAAAAAAAPVTGGGVSFFGSTPTAAKGVDNGAPGGAGAGQVAAAAAAADDDEESESSDEAAASNSSTTDMDKTIDIIFISVAMVLGCVWGLLLFGAPPLAAAPSSVASEGSGALAARSPSPAVVAAAKKADAESAPPGRR